MKPQDVFGIIVRTIGLWLIAQSVLMITGIFSSPAVIVAVIISSGVGFGLFIRADLIVDASYNQYPPQDVEPPVAN